jgi:hypothetical protein
MSAMFAWPERISRPSPKVGDRRTVNRLLVLPKKLQREWRWLGLEQIVQEFQRYRACPPEMKAMDVVGWRDICWADDQPCENEGQINPPPRKP